MYANELRRMLEAGVITQQDLQPNELAMLVGEMPQPRYDIAPMQQNTMRFENGPDEGRVVNMDFAKQPQQQAQMAPQRPQERLGDVVEVAGKGKGRYSADGSKVVGQGWIHDLFPKRTALAEKAAMEKAKAEAEIQSKRATTLKSMFDMQPKPQLVEGPNGPQWVTPPARGGAPQPVFNGGGFTPDYVNGGGSPESAGAMPPPNQAWLEKKYGKPPEDQVWNPDGTPRTIPGSKRDEGARAAESKMVEGMDIIDQMIGKRDTTGNLVNKSAPHPGFESVVGAGIPLLRFIPGTDSAGFDALYGQITGKAFLQAFETLKGGGQITQIEGEKATQAINRMKLAQSEPEFIKAALEFRNNLRDGMAKAKEKQAVTRKGTLGAPDLSVQLPDGKRVTFPSVQAREAFRREAGF